MEWIKCSEALPQKQDYYLVVKKTPQITFMPFVALFKRVLDAKGFVDSDGDEVKPTHWMPLPSPPES